MKNNYKFYFVRYWNHAKGINDCWGNSQGMIIKARTEDEAKNKLIKKLYGLNIKYHNVRFDSVKTSDLFHSFATKLQKNHSHELMRQAEWILDKSN